MKIKCDWCGSWINDFDQVCPNCGGVNNNYNRHANGVPQTIEELKAWAEGDESSATGHADLYRRGLQGRESLRYLQG